MDLLVRRGQRKPVERTDDRPNGLCCDLRVEGRRVYLGVAEQDLDDADVDAIFEKMGGETVPQRVRSDPLVDVRGLGGLDDDAVELARSEEHTSELQSLMRISYAVFCLKKKKKKHENKSRRKTT